MSALYTEHRGIGPPLVLLHGWGMNLRIFDGLVTGLSSDYQLIAIDLAGHGRSRWQTHHEPVALLDELVPLVPKNATVLGWSLGSQLAMQLALRPDALVRALVLLNPTPRFLSATDWRHGVEPAVLQSFARALRLDRAQLIRDFFELQSRGSRPDVARMQALRTAMMNHGEATEPALAAGLTWLETQDLRAIAPRITQPALIISGQHDRVTPPGAARALAALLPDARHTQIQRAAHLPFISHPEQTLALVREFLATSHAVAA
jgi:pimeloyl-[acyl-carrier protein] methyl ester esterase